MKIHRITVYIIDTKIDKVISKKKFLNDTFIYQRLEKLSTQYLNNKNIIFKISS